MTPSSLGRRGAEFYHHPLENVRRVQEVIWNSYFLHQSYVKEITLMRLCPLKFGPLCNCCSRKSLPLLIHSPGLRLWGLTAGSPLPGGQRCLDQCHSVVTYESPVTSSSDEPVSSSTRMPAVHTCVNTREHTLGASSPSAPPAIPSCPAKPRLESGTSLGADSELWTPS